MHDLQFQAVGFRIFRKFSLSLLWRIGEVRNVKHVQANRSAFAAIREDGSVVTWGDADCGGDSGSLVAE